MASPLLRVMRRAYGARYTQLHWHSGTAASLFPPSLITSEQLSPSWRCLRPFSGTPRRVELDGDSEEDPYGLEELTMTGEHEGLQLKETLGDGIYYADTELGIGAVAMEGMFASADVIRMTPPFMHVEATTEDEGGPLYFVVGQSYVAISSMAPRAAIPL